jgi:hypothetical protein
VIVDIQLSSFANIALLIFPILILRQMSSGWITQERYEIYSISLILVLSSVIGWQGLKSADYILMYCVLGVYDYHNPEAYPFISDEDLLHASQICSVVDDGITVKVHFDDSFYDTCESYKCIEDKINSIIGDLGYDASDRDQFTSKCSIDNIEMRLNKPQLRRILEVEELDAIYIISIFAFDTLIMC